MGRKKAFLIFFITIFNLALFGKDFFITSYIVKLKVNQNSVIDVEEHIDVYFSTKRHGLIRKIPYKYKLTSSPFSKSRLSRGSTYSVSITNIKVHGERFSVRRKNGVLFIKIGNPKKLVSGLVHYDISYRVYGGLNEFKDHYELYWNVLGGEWGVRVDRFHFEIEVPEKAELSQEKILIFSGALGEKSNSLNVKYELLGKNRITSLPVNSPEGAYVTVVLWIDKEAISVPSAIILKVFFLNHPFLLTPIFLFLLLYLLWRKIGRDKKFTEMVFYKPPEDMNPAEAGVLIDDALDKRDIISIIINWAVSGIVKIKEIEGGSDYELIKLKDLPMESRDYEKVLFNELFALGNSVKVSSLKNKFYKTIQKVRRLINKEISSEKLYTPGSRAIGKILSTVGFFVLFTTIFVFVSYGVYDSLAVLADGIMMIIFGRIMPQKTEKGLEKFKVLKGFREFVEKVEKPVLEKMVKEDPMYFSKYLPYAIILGVEKKWAKKFEPLLKEPPDWYEGDYERGFSTVYFVSKLNSATSTITETLTSTPSGSGASGGSGFSGGGFSGGGFGGGGGDSW